MDIEEQPLLNKATRQDNRKCYRILGAILGFLTTIGGLLASFYANSDRILAVGACSVVLGGAIMIYSLFHDRHQTSFTWTFITLFAVLSFPVFITMADSKLYNSQI